jgi:hypothetical protein
MTLKLASRVLDFGLNALNTEADRLLLCSVEPTSYSHATANALGFKSVSAGALFSDPVDYTNGRKIASAAITSGTINTSGTPVCWAAIDTNNSNLLASGLMTPLSALFAGQKWNLESFTIDMPGKAADWWRSDSAVDLDFAGGRTWNGSTVGTDFTTFLSCSRASTGYAKSSTGLQAFATNVLRISDVGLLIEGARTNIIQYSQEMFDANWSQFEATTVDSVLAAPDGTTTASKMTESSNANRHMGAYQIMAEFVNTRTYCFSCFVKDGGRRYCVLAINDNASPFEEAHIIFDMQTGVITATGGALYSNNFVESFANGWYRITLVFVADTAGAGTAVIALSGSANPTLSQGVPTYQGDGSSFFYFWGAQVETNVSFPSSYIPTTTAAATRAADAITITGSAQTTIAAATASVMAQINIGSVAGVAANAVDSNGTNLLGFDATNHGLASITATLATSNTANRTTRDKLGLAWSGAGRSLVLNGGTVVTDANAQVPSSTQRLGSSSATNFVNAYIERLILWNSKISDATLQSVTAP